MRTKFYWHIHHDILCEPLTEPLKNRIKYIKKYKPEEEQELRLKLIKPVKGKLPKRVIKAWKAHNKAGEAYIKAKKAYIKAREAYDKAKKAYIKAYDKAGEAHLKAWKAHNKAWKAHLKTLTMKSVIKLHKKECGCDFKTSIFDN